MTKANDEAKKLAGHFVNLGEFVAEFVVVDVVVVQTQIGDQKPGNLKL